MVIINASEIASEQNVDINLDYLQQIQAMKNQAVSSAETAVSASSSASTAKDTAVAAKDAAISAKNSAEAAKAQVESLVNSAYTKTETDTKLALKQDKLTAGSNITITNNVISSTNTGTVTSVNGVTPDSSGNIAIDVSAIGVNVTPSMSDKYDLYYIDEEADGYEVATQADIDRVDGDIANRLEKNQGAENSGKYLKVDTDGAIITDTVSGGVDVQINDESITVDGVANIPLASPVKAGVVKISGTYGIYAVATGALYTMPATYELIDGRTPSNGTTGNASNHNIITPNKIDYAVKCALTDGKGAAYTDEEKASARERLGVDGYGEYTLATRITLEEETQAIKFDFENDANRMLIYIVVPKTSTAISYGFFQNRNGSANIHRFSTISNNTYASYIQMLLYKQNGRYYLMGGMAVNTINNVNMANFNSPSNNGCYKTNDYPDLYKDFRLYFPAALPIGTVIEVYRV